jgi:hypothetical protein
MNTTMECSESEHDDEEEEYEYAYSSDEDDMEEGDYAVADERKMTLEKHSASSSFRAAGGGG